jgi:hypothetical protein
MLCIEREREGDQKLVRSLDAHEVWPEFGTNRVRVRRCTEQERVVTRVLTTLLLAGRARKRMRFKLRAIRLSSHGRSKLGLGVRSSISSPFASVCPVGWTSQDSVDTFPTASGDFKLLGTYSAQVAVATGSIVERFDVVGDLREGQLPILVDLLLDAFLLQAAEERFRNRVVPAVSATAHARPQSIGSAEALPIVTSVLRALV